LRSYGVDAVVVELRRLRISDCTGCRRCLAEGRCCLGDDMSRVLTPLLLGSSIIIVSTPVYFDNVTALVKRFMDRTWCLRGRLRDRVLGAIAVGRGYGLDNAIGAVYRWGLKHEMIICHRGVRCRAYEAGEALRDTRALRDLEAMCKRLVEVAERVWRGGAPPGPSEP